MKKYFPLVLLLLGMSSHLSAQLSTQKLDLSNYVPGEQRYRFVDYGAEVSRDLNSNIKEPQVTLSANLSTFRNTARRQVTTRLTGGIFKPNTSGLSYFGSFQYESRNYFFKRAPKLYIVGDVGFYAQSYGNTNGTHQLNLSTGLGYGRIHVVNEVAIAERILEKITNEKTLRPTDKNSKVIELANYLTELKNKRYITNREEWKKELSSIIAFMTNMGLEVSQDAVRTQIEDLYETEPLIRREYGNRLSLTGRSNFFSINGFIGIDNTFGQNNLVLEYENKKYLSHKLQWDLSIAASYGKNDQTRYSYRTFPRSYSSTNITSFGLDYENTIHYLPNKDSRFSLSLIAGYQRQLYYNYIGLEPNPWPTSPKSTYDIGVNLEYEHRFARNLRVAFGLNANYDSVHKGSITPHVSIRF